MTHRGKMYRNEEEKDQVSQNRPQLIDLTTFFEPEGVAVVGSFKEGVFGGYVVIKSLLEAGYKGNIYPVNPAVTRRFWALRSMRPQKISRQRPIWPS